MRRWIANWRKLLFRLRRERSAYELAEEIEEHRRLKQEELRRCGLNESAVAEMSRREMGNVTLAKEECRDMWSFVRLERFWQDVRFAGRIFRRTPVFTAVAIVSLALGIGGNTAVFSLVNGLLLRPLPYAKAERLVRITGVYPRAAVPFFQQESRSMDVAAVSSGTEMNLTAQGRSSRVFGSNVTSNVLDVMGAPVARGRNFRSGEDLPGRDRVVLISDGLWRERFGGNSQVIGQFITLNGVKREVIGIMPRNFSYPSAAVQLWLPMRLDPANFLEFWAGDFTPLIARLRPGATLAEAQGETHRLTQAFRKTFPYPMAADWNADSTTIPLQQDIVGDARPKLAILLGAVGTVLLIACANVASLSLARATTRRREIALRASLGASRSRVVRQLLTESIMLSVLGAAVGLAGGMKALAIFKSLLPASLPGLSQVTIDWTVVSATAALALLTGLAFGLAPALSASQINLSEAMKTGSQRATAGFWTRFRSYLIVGQVALTLLLAVTAGLLLRSLYRLAHSDPGFRAANVETIRISPDQFSCRERAACVSLYDRVRESARHLPGVSETAISNSVPLDGDLPTIPVDVEDHPKTAEHPAPMLWFGAVTPQYFSMLEIPLLSGRRFNEADGASAPRVALISASTAKRFWPRENAVGKHIKPTGSKQWRTVVGVVGDTHQYSLSRALPSWLAGAIYMPYPQAEREDGEIPAAMTLLVKAARPMTSFGSNELHSLAQDQDPNVPVSTVRSLDAIASGSIAEFRATMRVFLGFASAAILLAAIGIYGLMSYWVSQRTYEIGLRVAIGATRQRIVSMIFAEGLRFAIYGIVGGTLAALLLTRFLRGLLYGVATTDILTFVAVIGLLLAVAVIASALPAWRAARIDPLRSLRAD